MNPEPTTEDIKAALTVFADALLDNLHERNEEALEPFEAYELNLREHLLRNPEQFKRSFINGYFLLNRLKN